MGQDERQAGTPVGGAEAAGDTTTAGAAGSSGAGDATADQGPRDPDEIRREIEQTREELGETVAAVAEKADVKAQAKAKVDDVKGKVTGKKDEFTQKAKDAAPEGGGDAAAKAQSFAQQNKTALIIAGVLVGGFLLGRITSRGD